MTRHLRSVLVRFSISMFGYFLLEDRYKERKMFIPPVHRQGFEYNREQSCRHRGSSAA